MRSPKATSDHTPRIPLKVALNVPVLGVHHLRKRGQFEPDRPSLDRVRGSSTITQFARSVWGIRRPGEGVEGPVRVEPLKCTFCKPPQPFGFTIEDGGRLQFQDAPEEDRPGGERERAEAFPLGMLKDGPQTKLTAVRIGRLLEAVRLGLPYEKAALAAGICPSTFYRCVMRLLYHHFPRL